MTMPSFKANLNYNSGYVHKLITLDTPHAGSAFAEALLSSNMVCRTGVCS